MRLFIAVIAFFSGHPTLSFWLLVWKVLMP